MKKVLLIGGGGTLGLYTADELLKLDYSVDVVCLENYHSENPNLTFINACVTDRLLTDLFQKTHYDTIIDFICYSHFEDWASGRNELLLNNTEQLIFLSSYRVYADLQHPITESAPRWLDVTKEPMLVENETYAFPKCRCEDWLRASSYRNWTIVRPLISFSHFRLDLVTVPSALLLDRILRHKKILLPNAARGKTAGVGWAGNIGKMLARLSGNEKALGETFTLGSGENRTWEDVADYYTALFGAEFLWVDSADYVTCSTDNSMSAWWMLAYDRLLDRAIDNTHLLEVTGLTTDDFLKIPDALKLEMDCLLAHPEWREKMLKGLDPRINQRCDDFIRRCSI